MPKLDRTEIAAIAARLREHARRATIEINYKLPTLVKSRTRNDLARRLRYLAAMIEDKGTADRTIFQMLTDLDTRNPSDAARHIIAKTT